MAANKYLNIDSGVPTQHQATDSSGGIGDAGKIVALDAAGKLALNLLPTGVGAELLNLLTFEDVSAGNLVNIFSDSGTVKARKADCSNSRTAHGFVKASVTAPATVDVYFEGDMTDLTSKTPGAKQYLSTGGAMTETAPSTSAYLVQSVGYATGTTTARIQVSDPYVLA